MTWAECQKQTSGFSGAIFKGFAMRDDALNYLYDGKIPEHEKKGGPLFTVSRSQHNEIRTPETKEEREYVELYSDTPQSDGDSFQKGSLIGIELPHGAMIHHSPRLLPQIIDPKTWEETEPMSYGVFVPPVLHKTNGTNYVNADRKVLETGPFRLVIYIDGSKRPTVNHRGSGAYCRFQGKDYGLAAPFTSEIGYRYQIKPDDYEKLSSPTMEYLALGETLWRFIQIRLPEVNGIPQVLNPRLKLTFVADYLGVKCFTDGTWSAEKDYIKKIKVVCDAIISFLKVRGIDVDIVHCNGHVGILGNELSDVMAKSTIAEDTIQILVKDLTASFLSRI